jgi:protein-S-isoprenylcysteine O-methyltransferase Ste14
MVLEVVPLTSLPLGLVNSPASLAVGAFQLCGGAAYLSESRGVNTAYSKFAKSNPLLKKPVASKYAMLMIYVPSVIVCAASMPGAASVVANGRELVVAGMLLAHFAKRVGETLLLHRYSGSADGPTAAFIGTYYALICGIILHFQSAVPVALYASVPWTLPLGAALFAVGETGNLAHHALLARLRRDPAATTRYTLPRGGLFHAVVAPHYFFELVAWLGIAAVACQLNALLVFCSMSAYLAGRAVATSKWYTENLSEAEVARLPKHHIVPGVF